VAAVAASEAAAAAREATLALSSAAARSRSAARQFDSSSAAEPFPSRFPSSAATRPPSHVALMPQCRRSVPDVALQSQSAAGAMRTVLMQPTRAASRAPVAAAAVAALAGAFAGCMATVPVISPRAIPAVPTAPATPRTTPDASRLVRNGLLPVLTGQPIDIADLAGRIVTDDFEDVFAFDVDGSNVVRIADAPGSEFDGAWSPDGEWVVYRDSTRGINENDEIFVARADGSERRNLSNDPANDWGPDWSPDGSTIAFNSDRDGRLAGYLMDPDGSNVRALDVDLWFEYPSWSPDGSAIVFESHTGVNYELFRLDLASGEVRQLTEAPGDD
jgi:dipeptidyl aminopeptidase/acylaminoacyl peptidase